jgi:arylsulfatase A-like enzyme
LTISALFSIIVGDGMNKKSFSTAALVAGVWMILGLGGCRRGAAPANLILITLDTLRADHVGAYGAKRARTPAIDALAREGVVFENAYSLIPITLPSHASIFFSKPPHAVKNYNNGQVVRKQRAYPSFVNLFRKEGFQTAAFVSLGVLASEFGLDEGFQEYSDEFPPERWYLSAEEVNQRAFPWLEALKGRKFFLWIHYSDPHEPYAPPDTADDTKLFLNDELAVQCCLNKYLTQTLDLKLKKGRNRLRFEVRNPAPGDPGRFMARLDKLAFAPEADGKTFAVKFSDDWYRRQDDGVFFLKGRAGIDIECASGPCDAKITFRGKLLLSGDALRDGYRSEVEYMDREIGKLWETLRRLGLFDRTAIVMAGDHGEGLGEYRNTFGDEYYGHIHYLNEVFMKVPLIVHVPSPKGKGTRRPEVATLLDVAPTIAGIMGFKGLPGFQGRDLLRLEKNAGTTVFQETYKPEAFQDRFAVLDGARHLIYGPETVRYEFFDLSQDPEEKRDLFDEGGPLPEIAKLKEKLETFARDVLKNKEDVAIDSKAEEMLKALGYVGNKMP